jgi:hypothetical protein
VEALQAEQFQMMLTAARLRQVGHDLPDAAELEPMPGEPGGDTDLWQCWMQVENEMLVRVLVKGSFQRHRWPRASGNNAPKRRNTSRHGMPRDPSDQGPHAAPDDGSVPP